MGRGDMHTEDTNTGLSHDNTQRQPRTRRAKLALLPLALVAVVAVGFVAGPARPDVLAFVDETPGSADTPDKKNPSEIATPEGLVGSDNTRDAYTSQDNPANDPPRATNDSASTIPTETSIVIPVLDNDTDADSSQLYILRSEIMTGTGEVTIISGGEALRFHPKPGSVGPWTITYVVTDGGDGFDQGTVTVLDGNQAPIANDDNATAIARTTSSIDVLANDEDDGEILRVVAATVSDPADTDATVVISPTGLLDFTAPTTPGTVVVEYVIEDWMLRPSTGIVTIDISAALPVAVDDTATTAEDTAVIIDVLANDGPDGVEFDQGSLRILTSSIGSVSLVNGGIRYEPPANAAGLAQVTYEICSTSAACDTAAVRITVTPVEDTSPFAAEGQLRIPSEAGPQVIPWIVVSSGQTTVTPAMTFSITTDRPELFDEIPGISPTGILTFSPIEGSAGTANTTITVQDPNTGTRHYRLALLIG